MGYVVFYLIVAFAATVPDDWSDRQTEAKRNYDRRNLRS